MRPRFEVGFLDGEDPFEIDDRNRPHLYKHVEGSEGAWVAYTFSDVMDVYLGDDTQFYEGAEDEAADWLMVGEVPGGDVLVVPLAPPKSGDVTQCRPIGIYSAPRDLLDMYLKDTR